MILTSKQLVLSVGELLADFIGQNFSESLFDASDFTRFQGGSPANMAANMARLGNQAALVACVGDDNLGAFLIEKAAETGIDVSHVVIEPTQPTSIVVVSRTKGTPDFIAYRTADCMIQPEHLPDQLLDQTALFHTTCFALSRNPAQQTIVDAARRASIAGAQISIDANYAPSIWPDRDNAWQVLTDYCSLGTLVKLSEDDAERLYGSPQTPEQVRADFHRMGAKLVSMTLGAEGSIVSTNNGESVIQLPGKPLSVVDATGAGDAYWAGFLTAWLDGCTPAECAGGSCCMKREKHASTAG
ncbi:MAG: carbohydrate kinase [Cytophagaceae bacterium]|nr:MAG: carbohydrate kinase [Cytophagaceae bacterium]